MVAPARKAQSKNCPLVNCPNETMPKMETSCNLAGPDRPICKPIGQGISTGGEIMTC